MLLNIVFVFFNLKSMTTILIGLTFLYLYVKFKVFHKWKRLGIYEENTHLLFGSIKDVFTGKYTENEIYNGIYQRMGKQKYAGCYYFWKPIILLKDPELIKQVMITDFDSFMDHPSLSDHSKTDRVIHSLFTMEGKLWKSRRVFFTASFTPKKIKDYFQGIQKQLESYLPYFNEKAKQNKEIELEDFTSRFMMNVITNTLFGITTDSVKNPNSYFIECSKYTTHPPKSTVVKMVLRFLMPNLYETLRLQTMPTKIWECFYPFVKDITEYREKNRILQDDLIGLMLRQKNNRTSGPELSLEEMVGHVYAFFEAGFDSTSLTISYSLYELSKNQDIQEKLRQEIDGISRERDRGLTYEALTDMNYMDKVFKETLRKYPPSGLTRRICTKDIVLDQIKISKGTHIIIPVEALHHDPNYYPKPEIFNPDRSKDSSLPYLPFGAGPRICIGMKLAEITVKIGLFKILSEFIILPSDLYKEAVEYDPNTIFISIRPKHGIWVRIAHRNKQK